MKRHYDTEKKLPRSYFQRHAARWRFHYGDFSRPYFHSPGRGIAFEPAQVTTMIRIPNGWRSRPRRY